MLRYFWFICAAAMAVNVTFWHWRFAEAVGRGTLAVEEARRFTRGAAFWLVAPCLALGLIALAAGWSDPFCAGTFSMRNGPSAASSVVILGSWLALLGWIWLGRGATVLGRIGAVLTNRPGFVAVSPAAVRVAITALIIASGVGAMIASNERPRSANPCVVTQPASSGDQTSGLQVVFLGLFAGTWLIGGNILVAQHYRRMGKSPWSGFEPFAFPFKDFNAKEWLMLLALAVLSLGFGAIALSLNSR